MIKESEVIRNKKQEKEWRKEKMIKTKFKDVGAIARKIAEIKSVKAVYLFGSYASGKQHALSDIDICVLGNLTEKDENKVLGKASDNFDISVFNNLPIYIKFRVLRDGKPLIVKDKNYINNLKIVMIHAYFDFRTRVINKRIMERMKNV